MNLILAEQIAQVLREELPPPSVMDYPSIDNSPRTRKMREIIRIADAYGWRGAITHYLDTRGESHIADLSDVQLDDLLDRMLGFVDAAETGSSLADCLPAT